MSQENVEIARKSLEAFRRGEFDLATEPWDPAGEWIPAMAGAVEDKVYRGHADLRRYFEELFESFSEGRPDDMEFRDLGNRVLVLYTLSVRGRGSGVAINQPGSVGVESFDAQPWCLAITLDTYSHAIPAMQEDAAAKIAALLA